MTANQVAYWGLQESKRHNLQDEAIRGSSQQAQAKRWSEQSRIEQFKADTERSRVKTQNRNDTSREVRSWLSDIGGSVQTGTQLAKVFM